MLRVQIKNRRKTEHRYCYRRDGEDGSRKAARKKLKNISIKIGQVTAKKRFTELSDKRVR